MGRPGPNNPNGEGGGRPRKWESQDQLDLVIAGYFDQFSGNEDADHPKHKKAPNLFGLCRYAEMSYDAFIDYESGSMDTETEKFSVPCKNARLMCLEYAGEHVYTHTAGSVFTHVNLTKKFKEPWKNAQAQELTGKDGGPVQIQGIAGLLAAAHEAEK